MVVNEKTVAISEWANVKVFTSCTKTVLHFYFVKKIMFSL